MLMKKNNLFISIIIIAFISLSCAKTDTAILQKDISRYSAIEEELNVKIRFINTQMTSSIAAYKKTKDFAKFEQDNKFINDEIGKLMLLTKEVGIHIASKEIKQYHKVTVKLIKIQAEYVSVIIEQFKTEGEHGNNDTKATQIKYNTKIRSLQKEQNELLEKIIKKTYEK